MPTTFPQRKRTGTKTACTPFLTTSAVERSVLESVHDELNRFL